MKPQYITIIGGTPAVVALDNDMVAFNVSVRTDATTLEVTLEDPTAATATWVAAPAAGANGLVNLTYPVRALRFTKATNGVATILQQGLR